MDKTDVTLSMLLLMNSRTSYRDLADKLGLSVNAVHKRIQSMMEQGVIRTFETRLNLLVTGGVIVWVFGHSEKMEMEEIRTLLQKNRNVYWMAVTGADYLLVGLYIKDLVELDINLRDVVLDCGMKSPFIGIIPFPNVLDPGKELNQADFRILRSLAHDSRKTVAEVAQETSLSAKTVRRRLERMETKGMIEYTINWYPDESNDIMTFFQVFLEPGADKYAVGQSLFSKNNPEIIFYQAFSNVPDQLILVSWSPTTKELKALRERLASEPGVAHLVPNIIYSGYIFPTWRDDLIEQGAKRVGKPL